MFEVNSLRNGLNCMEIVRSELGEPSIRRGYYASWRCPFCGKSSKTSFTAWEKGYKCWKGCSQGDVVSFIMRYRDLSFPVACRYLGAEYQTEQAAKPTPKQPTIRRDDPPCDEWVEDATELVMRAQNVLWEDKGKRGLDYLRQRGLNDDTILRLGFGYVPPTEERLFRGINLVHGILIPTYREGKLWNARYRTFSKNPAYRYLNMTGGRLRGSLFFETLPPWQPLLLVEGDFNAAILDQLGYHAASTSSATNTLSQYWLKDFLTAPIVLVWGDDDPAGQAFNAKHAQLASTFKPLYHEGGDANELFLSDPKRLACLVETWLNTQDELEAYAMAELGAVVVSAELQPRNVTPMASYQAPLLDGYQKEVSHYDY